MKKLVARVLAAAVAICLFALPIFVKAEESAGKGVNVANPEYYKRFVGKGISINVHNWGEYISNGSDGSMNVIKEFENLTDIKVNYTTFSTNEEVYARLKSGGASYDVIIPTDYGIARLIREDMLEKLNFENIPNIKYISKSFDNSNYDPQNEYSVPYMWGTVGIIYNKEMVDEADIGSWDLLWNEKYIGDILMFSNQRDAFGIALKRLGHPMNPENETQLRDATDSLKEQKLLVQAYVMDEIFDKMLGGEAAIAPYYAGDAITMMAQNENLGYFVPEEGTNRFVDAIVIPRGAKEKEAAEMFINFMQEPEVAAANAEYIGYSSPNDGALELMDPEVTHNEVAYPPESVIAKTEFFVDLPVGLGLVMDKMWTEVLSADESYSRLLIPALMGGAILASVSINILRSIRKRREQELIDDINRRKKAG